jgi:hypothetical protein
MDLVPSQEPEAPTIPDFEARGGRTRHQTRRSKLVEETQQHETLPTGDEVELRETRAVNEIVKRVAVVHPRDAAPATEETQDAERGSRRRPAGPERTARGDTSARLEEELDAAMAGADAHTLAGGVRRAAPTPGANVRGWQQVTVEEGGRGEPAEDGADEGIAAEEPPAEMHRAKGAQKRRNVRRRGGRGKQPTEGAVPPTEELAIGEAEGEPEVDAGVVSAAQRAVEQETTEGDQYMTPQGPSPGDLGPMDATPADVDMPPATQTIEALEEQVRFGSQGS